MNAPVEVNPHYLSHVVQVGKSRDIEASEDIFSGTGMKLLAKGARIDESVKDRLLQHKLRKPLEECMRVAQGLAAPQLSEVAEVLLDEHPMLRALFSGEQRLKTLRLLGSVPLSPPVQSLLTIYAEHLPRKLHHTVGTALLGCGLAGHLPQADGNLPATALLAGLCHDVGELYINPDYLARQQHLTPAEWRHIAAHPVIAQRVLKGMAGIPSGVQDVVLHHHERLDGFGYPGGLSGLAVALGGQVMAAAELLIGLMESGPGAAWRADVAMKLIPGEFNTAVTDVISSVCRTRDDINAALTALPSAEQTLDRAEELAGAVRHFDHVSQQLQAMHAQASAPLKNLTEHTVHRFGRVRRAYASTGLDFSYGHPGATTRALLDDDLIHLEITHVLRELSWRLRELDREIRLRAQNLVPVEASMLTTLLDARDVPGTAPA